MSTHIQYLILCIYGQNNVNDKILIMPMNEQIRLLCTWGLPLSLSDVARPDHCSKLMQQSA
jgi:hypothetical protein